MNFDKQAMAEQIILATPVFRSSEIIERGDALGISKRTIDTAIKELSDKKQIIAVSRGIYANADFSKKTGDFSLACVADKYQTASTVSLFSSLSVLQKSHSGNVYSIVPAGKIGELETPIGTVYIHQVSKRMIDAIVSAHGVDACYSKDNYGLSVHTPEMAMAVCAYLEGCGKKTVLDLSAVEIGSVDVAKKINWEASAKMLYSANLPDSLLKPVQSVIEKVVKREKDGAREADSSPSM